MSQVNQLPLFLSSISSHFEEAVHLKRMWYPEAFFMMIFVVLTNLLFMMAFCYRMKGVYMRKPDTMSCLANSFSPDSLYVFKVDQGHQAPANLARTLQHCNASELWNLLIPCAWTACTQ